MSKAAFSPETAAPHDAADDLVDRGDDALEIEDEAADPATAPAADPVADPAADPAVDPAADPAVDPAADPAAAPTPAEVPNAMIPRARLNEVRAKQKAAEARVAELEAQLNAARDGGAQNKNFEAFTAKVDTLYESVALANAEGDYKQAAKLQRELDDLRENATLARQQYVAQQEALRTQETTAYNALVDQIELLVPELNPRNEGFDEDTMQEVDSVTRGLEAQGMRTADALRKAVKYVIGKDVFSEASIRRETAPATKKTDIAKNVAAAKKIPPTVDGAPEKNQEIDPAKLSDAEYAKLPESTKARLRGDFV